MDNNVSNTNLSNSVSPSVGTNTTVANTVNTNVTSNPGVVNVPGTVNTANVSNGVNVANNTTGVNPNGMVAGSVNATVVNNPQMPIGGYTNTVNVAPNNANNIQKGSNKLYVWIFVFVGIVMVAAVILLILLFSGTIENRNRLTCTKTTQEEGYDYTIKRYYILEDGINQRLELTYTFDYNGSLTDDLYESTFRQYIDNDTTKYGFDTKVTRDGDIVTITAYQPTFFNETEKELRTTNSSEGYSCK